MSVVTTFDPQLLALNRYSMNTCKMTEPPGCFTLQLNMSFGYSVMPGKLGSFLFVFLSRMWQIRLHFKLLVD